jgi:hypothetical protein
MHLQQRDVAEFFEFALLAPFSLLALLAYLGSCISYNFPVLHLAYISEVPNPFYFLSFTIILLNPFL